MKLKTLWLADFRNHEDFVLELPRMTVVVGANGSGKTNLMEAIYLLATGKSFRAERIEEMVKWGKEVGRVKGEIQEEFGDKSTELEVVVTRGEVQGKKVPRKSLMVNGVRRQLRTFAGNLRVVMFGPGDMRLIEGSPSRRRNFLDEVLSQIYPDYYRALLSYEKGVRRRNKVLQAIKEGVAGRSQLYFWDRLLIKEGQVITRYRRELIEFLNSREKIQDSRQEDGQARFKIHGQYKVVYDSSVISEQRLKQYGREEVAAGVTLVGPHRDDMIVKFQGESDHNDFETSKPRSFGTIDLATYGSRGQQRMAVLWLKLGQLAFMEKVTGEKPVLLLDDIFSELDHEHRKVVMQVVNDQQTVMTTADEHLVEGVKGKVVKL